MKTNILHRLKNLLTESEGMIDIQGQNYKCKDVVSFAMAYEPRTVTVQDAIKLMQKLNVLGEFKRLMADKDKNLDYVHNDNKINYRPYLAGRDGDQTVKVKTGEVLPDIQPSQMKITK